MPGDSSKGSCAVCQADAVLKCSSCHRVYYCDKTHQKQDWKRHKNSCCPYKIHISPIVGRQLLASRDLKPGEIILQEKAIVVGPKQITPMVCLGCYQAVDGSYTCGKCGWPVCGPHCQDSADHVPECHVTSKSCSGKIQIRPVKQDHPSYQCITLLRCLHLRETDPEKWRQLLDLQSHRDARQKAGLEDSDRVIILRFLREQIHLDARSYPDDLIFQLCGILNVNSFEMPLQGEGLQGVFPQACLLQHDCVANAVKTFQNDRSVVLRAAVPISKGDPVTITYTDPLWGTMNRQTHLFQSKFFNCRCQRCQDPTELGTMLSAIVCPVCSTQSGGPATSYLLPQSPLHDEGVWKGTQCEHTTPTAEVHRLIEKIGQDLIAVGKGDPAECERFLERYEGKVLHPHHFYLVDVKLALVQMYGHLEGQELVHLGEELLTRKEQLCFQLLQLIDVIAPGLTRLRGILLYEMQAILALRSRHLCVEGGISKDELIHRVQVVKKMLQEASKIFSWEPDCLDEHRLGEIAAMELKDVELFLRSLQF